jgi:Protein of unknown function (DUF2587)
MLGGMDEQKQPELIIAPAQAPEAEEAVAHPAKLIRIASMIRELVEEVRQTSLDQEGRKRLQHIYNRSVAELKETLTESLQKELDALAAPLEGGSSESEIRVAQAQLLGWLEGLFHGIQAALWSQHAQAQAALQEMRRRGLPSGVPGRPPPGPGGPPGSEPDEPKGPPGQYL